MAIDMSANCLRQFSIIKSPLNHILIKLQRIRQLRRKVLNKVLGPPALEDSICPPSLTSLPDNISSVFRREGWLFLDPFLNSSFAKNLEENWPPIRYFSPMAHHHKTYDFGFRWSRGETGPIRHITLFPWLQAIYSYILSESFAQKVNIICDDHKQRHCYTITSTFARGGSALIPHRDTVFRDDPESSMINIIIFVGGNGSAPHAGGTCIAADNELNDIIFEPKNLNNTALIYKSTAAFFHGFRPMAKGSYRHAILAQFCE